MLPLLLSVWLFLVAQNTSTLQGTVITAGTSDPVGGVEISLSTTSDPRTRIRTTSDTQGSFVFENLPAGKYVVQANREGFFNSPQGNPLPSIVANVTVDTATSHRILITLIAGAVISGTITDVESRPMAGVQMSAMKLQYEDGRPVFAVGTPVVVTNNRGEYRIPWLPPGEYYVRAEYSDPQQQFARRTYYPGTTDSLTAVPLMIRGGESQTGTSFTISRVRTIRLSGQVATEATLPASGTFRTFYLMPQDGRPQEAYPFELTNLLPSPPGEVTSNFILETRGIPPGSYELAPFFIDPKATYHTGRTRVEIGEDDVENITAIIDPNVDVTGKIVFEPAGNLAGIQIQLRARDATIPLMSRSNTAAIAADKSFVIRGVPAGRYFVYLAVSSRANTAPWYVSDMRQGAADIRNDGIVEIRAATLPLEITIRAGAGNVRGVVDAPGGVVPARADVVLVPNFSLRANPLFYGRTGIDDMGRFSFEGIAPGEYKVFAFEQLQDSAEQNALFIARYETLGQPVTVRSESTTETRARLLR